MEQLEEGVELDVDCCVLLLQPIPSQERGLRVSSTPHIASHVSYGHQRWPWAVYCERVLFLSRVQSGKEVCLCVAAGVDVECNECVSVSIRPAPL